MIGYDQEVEWPGEFHGLAAGSRNLLALRKAIRFPRTEARAKRAGIHRERRVQVRVAE
jgi:hypothetical protein